MVNVRGQAFPVVDLRLPITVDTLDTRVIVIDLNIDSTTAIIGSLAYSIQLWDTDSRGKITGCRAL